MFAKQINIQDVAVNQTFSADKKDQLTWFINHFSLRTIDPAHEL